MRSLSTLIVSVLSVLYFASFLGSVCSAPTSATSSCQQYENPIVRKEWRTLQKEEKEYYIKAVKCLQNRPAISRATIPHAVSRFDDFQGVHIQRTPYIHFVGHFLAWHRYFVATYEKALREECNYTGAQPYWDWTLDSGDFFNSPLWDPKTGFGGNGATAPPDKGSIIVPGATGGGCITDGPFVDMRLHLGPHSSLGRADRCLRRGFSPEIAAKFSNAAKVNKTLSQANFGSFDKVLEGDPNFTNVGIHGAGHFSIGGEAGDLYASPGEPVFYLHHANLDRIYWRWQSMDLKHRLLDVSGHILPFNSNSPNVTLDFPIELGPLAQPLTVRDLMDIKGLASGTGPLCYDYQ